MEQGKQHITDIIFVLSLFCVFAVLALFVVVLGAGVYKDISAGMTKNYNARTSLAYITEKVRQNDVADAIGIDSVGENKALVLTSSSGETAFETWIYVYDGVLKEVTVKAGSSVSPEDGQAIMELSDMDVEFRSNGLLRVEAIDADGYSFMSTVAVKSGVEGGS